MSLMRRMRDITAASINELLEQAEDPVQFIDNYLRAQQEQIRQSEALYQQCVNHAQSLRQQYLSAEQLKEKREQQATLALKAGEEEVARLALQEKMQQEEKSEQYRELYEQSQRSIIELEEQLNQLKSDYQEVADKRDYYMARIESVRLQRRMEERLERTKAHAGVRMFHRLEERVSDLEIEARSLRDVRRLGREMLHQAGGAVQQALEIELRSLKQKLEKEGWLKP